MDAEGSNETLGVGVGGVGLSRFGGSVAVVVVVGIFAVRAGGVGTGMGVKGDGG